MRFGIQILSLKPDSVGGQDVFIRRLLTHLVPQLEGDRLVLFIRPEVAAESPFKDLAANGFVELVIETPELHYGRDFARWNLNLLGRARLDCIYFPLFFFYPRPLPIPVVIHVPDLQHGYFPEYFSPDQLAWRRERIPASVELANAVITYTHFSARCLIDKLGADSRKLHVISAGGFPEEQTKREVPEPPSVVRPIGSHPFIYYPAADWPHKNHETLLRAVAMLAQRGRPERLVLTGMLSQRGDVLRALIGKLGLSDRVHLLGCVPQETVIHLYRTASLMAFPSRFEGFGLPLVEAMQLGCPIVASKAEAVMETAGSAAVFCDDNAETWARELGRLLSDPAMLADLRTRGLERAADFDCHHCAARHLALFRDLASPRHTAKPASTSVRSF
ncbi:MAG: glycosyltransferase family 1 protein [Planctomycetota bacterium]